MTTNLLLHFDGATGSTTFTDSSLAGVSVTAPSGLVALTSATSKFGGSSAAFSGGYLSIPNGDVTSDASGDFCYDFWSSTTSARQIFIGDNSYPAVGVFGFQAFSAGGANYPAIYIDGSTTLNSSIAYPNDGSWNHFEFSRTGTTYYLFIGGNLAASASSTIARPVSTSPLLMNYWSPSSQPPSGGSFIDEFRIQTGTGVGHTANFTPPTSAYTIDLIPVMTSDTAPSGVASANAAYDGAPAWNAFADGTPHGWLDIGGGFPAWLQYQFASATAVGAYGIIPWGVDNFPGRSPTNWTFEGSLDGSTWVTLDTQTGYTSWTADSVSKFMIANTTAYSYYRINITANVGGLPYNAIHQFEMYAPFSTTSSSVSATITITEADDTLSATASHPMYPVSAILAISEASDTLYAIGSHPYPIDGSLAITEASDTLSATASHPMYPVSAAISILEAGDTLSASGVYNVPISAVLTIQESDDTFSAGLLYVWLVDVISFAPTPVVLAYGGTDTLNTGSAVVSVNVLGNSAGNGQAVAYQNVSGSGTTGTAGVSAITVTTFINAHGTTGSNGAATIRINLPISSLSFGGNYSLGVAPTPYVSGSGATGSGGSSRITIPGPSVSAIGQSSYGGYAIIRIPTPIAFSGNTGASIIVPKPSVTARGRTLTSYRMVSGVPVQTFPHNAWSTNLRKRGMSDNDKYNQAIVAETTEWQDFPMSQIFRFMDDYYGIGMDGNMYKIGGTTDDGYPISWSIKTAMTDFDTVQFKAPNSVYVGGRIQNDFTVNVIADNDVWRPFPALATRGTGPCTTRVRIAKGYKARYYGFGVSNTNGTADIQTLNVEIIGSERS